MHRSQLGAWSRETETHGQIAVLFNVSTIGVLKRLVTQVANQRRQTAQKFAVNSTRLTVFRYLYQSVV